ncbi:MAG: terminase small subunit, partial [Stellaceae bacterium]
QPRSPMPFYKRKRPLSPRQQKFVEQYLITGVARQAALRAGYSPAGAGAIAWRLKRMPNVAKAIRLGRSSEARRAQVERDRVLLELVRVAFSDIGEVLDWTSGEDITLRPKDEISPHQRAAIAEIAPRRNGKGARVRFHNKAHALDAIARHLGLFDKQPPTIDVSAQRRAGQDARTILLERLKRLKRTPDHSAASLNAGAPLGLPSTLAPLAGRGQGEGAAFAEKLASADVSAAASLPPIPSPSMGEG